MAKVMVSLPDGLLADLDREAERRGTTRSGLLRKLAEEMLGRRQRRMAERIDEIMGDGVDHGGDGLAALKAARAERFEKLAR